MLAMAFFQIDHELFEKRKQLIKHFSKPIENGWESYLRILTVRIEGS